MVGSAIGDAMGASTEMWRRNDIQLKYGYINGFTPAVREQSPEGTWGHNLTAGATTDDTRWKFAMVKYLSKYQDDGTPSILPILSLTIMPLLPEAFQMTRDIPKTDFLDTQIEKIDWIKEWARVAMAYRENPETYQRALNRFYGGEMSCAGQLYTPMFGLVSATPEEAYNIQPTTIPFLT